MARHTPDLRRQPEKREPKQRFIIFCEGANTEPHYFDALRRACNNALIDVVIIGPAGVPLTLARNAKEKADELGLSASSSKSLDSFEEADQVWAVFDRDEHPNFQDAVAVCENNGVGVGRSNPCFEVWLILHVQDFDKPDGRKAVQTLLKKLCPGYSPSKGKKLNCAELVAHVEEAEERAKRLLERRVNEGNAYGPPSSTVGSLTFAIREAARKHRS
jgi:hypothetical protein